MPCFTAAEVPPPTSASRCNACSAWTSSGSEPDELDRTGTGLAPGVRARRVVRAGDGYIDAPRNVLAYTAALVALRRRRPRARTVHRVCTDPTASTPPYGSSGGDIDAGIVVLTGGPDLAAVGTRRRRRRIIAGGTRHQVVVTAPLPGTDPATLPMVFDVGVRHLLAPGRARRAALGHEQSGRAARTGRRLRLAVLRADACPGRAVVPGTAGLGLRRAWAATIDYTPDHLPILGPLLRGGEPGAGTIVAAAGGHGMMWGPGVARAAADLALHGRPTSSTSPISASTASTPTGAAGWPPTPSPSPSRRGPDHDRRRTSHAAAEPPSWRTGARSPRRPARR